MLQISQKFNANKNLTQAKNQNPEVPHSVCKIDQYLLNELHQLMPFKTCIKIQLHVIKS